MAVGPAGVLIEQEVRDAIRTRGIDPIQDRSGLHTIIDEVINQYDSKSLRGEQPVLVDRELTTQRILDAVSGLGPLQQYLDDDDVEEIWVNGPAQVFVARSTGAELTPTVLAPEQLRDLVELMLRASGRRLDLSSPFVDACLPGGERLHVVIPDITRKYMAVNIRKHVLRASSIHDLVRMGSLNVQAAEFLDAAVRAGLNILVAGATQAGKTTMLNALAGSIPVRERVITAEEVFELRIPHRDVVAMQCRQPSLEGTGEVTLRRLVKEALRMRPERIIIGEVREAESLDLLIALNAGVPGMATLHANTAREAVTKMCTLPLLAGENVSSDFVVPTVAGAIDIVMHLGVDADGTRRVREICGLSGRVESGRIEMSDLFKLHDNELRPGTGSIPAPERFERIGINPHSLLRAGGF